MKLFRGDSDSLIEERPDLFRGDKPRERGPLAKVVELGSEPPDPPAPLTSFKAKALRFTAWTGFVAVWLPVAAGGAMVGALAAWLEVAPPIEEFESYNPPQATTILDRGGEPVSALFAERRFVVPISQMAPKLAEAFIAVEDERYYHHIGVDPVGIARAMAINATRGRMSQGASTVTQQTARNLLDNIGNQRTTERKLTEMLASVVMENRYAKDQILEVYLNQIYLGSGSYGVQAAAMTYFGKSASELTLAECATLAGLPQAPERFSPLNNPELTLRRRNHVLFRMLQNGIISDAEYDRAVTSELELNPQRVSPGRSPYFVDAVRRAISRHPNLGEDSLRSAGWRIQTTMDPRMQSLGEQVLRAGLDREEANWLAGRQDRFGLWTSRPEHQAAPRSGQYRMASVQRIFARSLVVTLPGGWRADLPIPEATAHLFQEGTSLRAGEGVDLVVTEVDPQRGLFRGRLLPQQRLQGALVALDSRTGDIRAIVGGRMYADPQNNGFYNRALLARRQAGSTFKPFLFAAGLEDGLMPSSTVSDTALAFGDGYAPKNFDNRFMGQVTLQYSLEHSRNIPTFRVVQHVGLRRSIEFLRAFQRVGDTPWAIPREWPIVLGTTSVTPLELAAAYQPLANGGLARGPRLVEGIWNDGHREAPLPDERAPQQVIGEMENARLLQMMIGVVNQGTGASFAGSLPPEIRDRVAGKSGTTDEHRDAWFAGFTPWEVVVVWIGFDTPVPLARTQTGGRAAGSIWGDYIAKAWELKDSEERQRSWTLPPDTYFAQVGIHRGAPVWRLATGRAPESHQLPTIVYTTIPPSEVTEEISPAYAADSVEWEDEGAYDLHAVDHDHPMDFHAVGFDAVEEQGPNEGVPLAGR